VLAAAKASRRAEGRPRRRRRSTRRPHRAGARPAAAPGERREERVRMTRLRQTIASRLKEAQNTAAMLTTFNDVDMSAVMEARSRYKDLFDKKHGIGSAS
jgi:2-oxoglutarate dehydrogenase E2 component (dihydrolipoamide succinyltransferase)